MLPEIFAPVIFFLIKWSAYVLYCRTGAAERRSWKQAVKLAAARVGLGLLTAQLVFILVRLTGSHSYGNRMGFPEWGGSFLPFYFLVYGSLRLVQWRAIAAWGACERPWRWSAVGAAVSFVTDAVGLLTALRAVGGIC